MFSTWILLIFVSVCHPPITSVPDCDDITPNCAEAGCHVMACGPDGFRTIHSPAGVSLCETESPGLYCYDAYREAINACGCAGSYEP